MKKHTSFLIFVLFMLISVLIHFNFYMIISYDFSEMQLLKTIQKSKERIVQVVSDSSKEVSQKIKDLVSSIGFEKNNNLSKEADSLIKEIRKHQESPVKALTKSLNKSLEKVAEEIANSSKEIAGEFSKIKKFGENKQTKKQGSDFDQFVVSVVSSEDIVIPDNSLKNFGGIGLSFSHITKTNTYMVVEVAPESPALRAGIKKGDVIEGDPLRFRGPVGSEVLVEILRDGKRISFNLVRDTIYYRSKKENGGSTVDGPIKGSPSH